MLAVVVLGAGCTGDAPLPSVPGKPVCDRIPGRGVEGFVLDETKRFDEEDHIAVRKQYRDRQGRLLVYLLGLSGEIGEGAEQSFEVELVDDTPARFMGSGENWLLVWEGSAPCRHVAVVGNGFRRADFVALLVRADLVPAGALGPIGDPGGPLED